MVRTFVYPSLPTISSPFDESRQEAEDTPKTMSFMHLHLGLEGALPAGTDVSKLATPQQSSLLALTSLSHADLRRV